MTGGVLGKGGKIFHGLSEAVLVVELLEGHYQWLGMYDTVSDAQLCRALNAQLYELVVELEVQHTDVLFAVKG